MSFIDEIRDIQYSTPVTKDDKLEWVKGIIRGRANFGLTSAQIIRHDDELNSEIKWLKENGFSVEITDQRSANAKYTDIVVRW